MSEVAGEPRELTVDELLGLYVDDRTMIIAFDGHCTRWRALIKGLKRVHDAVSFSYWSPECNKTGSAADWEPLVLTGEVIHISDIEKIQLHPDGSITFRNSREFDRQYTILPPILPDVSMTPSLTGIDSCPTRILAAVVFVAIAITGIISLCH